MQSFGPGTIGVDYILPIEDIAQKLVTLVTPPPAL